MGTSSLVIVPSWFGRHVPPPPAADPVEVDEVEAEPPLPVVAPVIFEPVLVVEPGSWQNPWSQTPEGQSLPMRHAPAGSEAAQPAVPSAAVPRAREPNATDPKRSAVATETIPSER